MREEHEFGVDKSTNLQQKRLALTHFRLRLRSCGSTPTGAHYRPMTAP